MSDPKYLAVTYSEAFAPASSYPSKLAMHLLQRFYLRTGRLLDIGSGRGDFLRAFSELGFDVAGIDISIQAREFGMGFQVEVADLESDEIPYPTSHFDFVFCKSVIEHMRMPTALLRQAMHVLKPGGTAVYMTPSWVHNAWGPFYCDHTHVTPFTLTSMATAMEICGYADVSVRYFYQLPFLWKMPFLLPCTRLLAWLPLPYRPFYRSAPRWPATVNKLIRFSKETMILAVGRKAEFQESKGS